MANRQTPKNAFEKGKSKNPVGRPKGSLNKHSLYQQQMEENAPEWIKRLNTYILEGDKQCLMFALRYVLRKEKDAPLPEIALVGTLKDKLNSVMQAASKGILSEKEASTYLAMVKAESDLLIMPNLQEQIDELKKGMPKNEQN